MTVLVCAGQSLTGGFKQATLQQPQPIPPHDAFLKDVVNSVNPSSSYSSLHTFVSEWLESIGSDRKKCCRSDSYLHYSHDISISNSFARSAPEMDSTRDNFVVPSTPASAKSRSRRADTDAESVTPSSTQSYPKKLVEQPDYRMFNLAANNVYMRNPDEEFPEHITELIHYIRQDRDSPGPSPDQLTHSAELYGLEDYVLEAQVENYFKAEIFSEARVSSGLKRIDRSPMAKHTVPTAEPPVLSMGSILKLGTPVPDMLYGYDRREAFPQQTHLISMGSAFVANTQHLLFPFFAVEFKGEGGSLWVATNQCIGASVSCVNVTERLNYQLTQCKSDEIQPINSAVFSIAMNGTEARLYISWKHSERDFYMQKIDSFLLQNPQHYLEFRKYVRNIIDWGKDRRLNEIRNSLDMLQEDSRKRASVAAKSRQPPSDASATYSSKKYESSSSPRNSSKPGGV